MESEICSGFKYAYVLIILRQILLISNDDRECVHITGSNVKIGRIANGMINLHTPLTLPVKGNITIKCAFPKPTLEYIFVFLILHPQVLKCFETTQIIHNNVPTVRIISCVKRVQLISI